MATVQINIELPTTGSLSMEELKSRIREYALRLVGAANDSDEQTGGVSEPPCCYSVEEAAALAHKRAVSMEDGEVTGIPHETVAAGATEFVNSLH